MSEASSSFELSPRRVAFGLGGIVLVLVAISILLNIGKVAGVGVPEWLVDLFRLNQELNIPSFYSGVLFVLVSLLSCWASTREQRVSLRSGWIFMAAVFLFLSFDELFSVHERLIEPLRNAFDVPDFLQFAWVEAYAVLLLVVGLAFWPLWRSLEKRVKLWLAFSAVAYLSGAVGFETISGAVYSGTEGDILYGILYTIEESLEMAGLVISIYGLLLHLRGSTLGVVDETASPAQTER